MAKQSKVRGYRVPVNLERVGFWLPPDLLARARNAVVGAVKRDQRVTLAGLVRRGLEREIVKLERHYNGGKPFPQRSGELRRGSRPR